MCDSLYHEVLWLLMNLAIILFQMIRDISRKPGNCANIASGRNCPILAQPHMIQLIEKSAELCPTCQLAPLLPKCNKNAGTHRSYFKFKDWTGSLTVLLATLLFNCFLLATPSSPTEFSTVLFYKLLSPTRITGKGQI